MVAQWLASKIHAKRINLIGSRKLGSSQQIESPPNRPGDKETSRLAGSTISFLTSKSLKSPSIAESTFDSHGVAVDLGDDFEAPQRAMPVVLDVFLERKVDIDKLAYIQWRGRRVPRIPGIKCTIKAIQDLDMLRFDVKVIIPHPKMRLIKQDNLLDFSKFYEDEEFFDDEAISTDGAAYPPTIVELQFSLTGGELLVFGSARLMEEHNVSFSAAPGGTHPAAFMYNILNRYNICVSIYVGYIYRYILGRYRNMSVEQECEHVLYRNKSTCSHRLIRRESVTYHIH